MAEENTQYQLVTFQLGDELYGVDIMDVKEIVKVQTVREPKYLGTIGSIKFVETFYNDTVLVMNSDLFTNINYEDFYLHFKEHDADMSVAAVPYSVQVPYGILNRYRQMTIPTVFTPIRRLRPKPRIIF